MWGIWDIWLGDPKYILSSWARDVYKITKSKKVKQYIIHPLDAIHYMNEFGDDEELRKTICGHIYAKRYCAYVRDDIPEINHLINEK